MIDIPADIQIRVTLKPGAVYYFVEPSFSSSDPHFFIVLNHDPVAEQILFTVCSSSRIDKVKARRRNCSESTLVEISPEEYPGFSVVSIVDCNNVYEYTVDDLINKVVSGKLRLKPEMMPTIINSLRKSVCESRLVSTKIKNRLRKIFS